MISHTFLIGNYIADAKWRIFGMQSEKRTECTLEFNPNYTTVNFGDNIEYLSFAFSIICCCHLKYKLLPNHFTNVHINTHKGQ